MTSSNTIVPVALGERSYDIHVGSGLLARAGDLIKPILSRPRTAIVTDETVAGLHLPTLEASLEEAGIIFTSVILPPGEATKNFQYFEEVLEQLLAAGIERSDQIIAFGGGVIGDLTGFVAASLRRGIGFIQIPTTLLAQVDSSVGGKTAINSAHGKNLVGAFHQPSLVLADVDVLSTLPERQMRAGYAEVLKYALLGDADFFDWLDQNGAKVLAGDRRAQTQAVVTACKAKAAIVAADEREAGQRALLNLGHTFGHALEAETGYSDRLLHGEGVAIGLGLAFQLSEALGLSPQTDTSRVLTHLENAGLPAQIGDIPELNANPEKLLAHIAQDKKVVDGAVTLVLVKGLGNAFLTRDVDHDRLKSFLTEKV